MKEFLKPNKWKIIIAVLLLLISIVILYDYCWVGVDCPGCDYLNVYCFIISFFVLNIISYLVLSLLFYLLRKKNKTPIN